LINQTNAGPSKSRNNGAHIATGTYLMFLDAGSLAPTYIDSCIANLERDKNLNIVYTEGEYFGTKKENGIYQILAFQILEAIVFQFQL
jgi:hypothetical protein